MSKTETHYIYDAVERTFLALSNGGLSPREEPMNVYMPPRALWGCVRAQKKHQIELALSNGGLSLREEPVNIYIYAS